MSEETAINIAVTCVMSSFLDDQTKQQVIEILRTFKEETT